MVFVEVGHEQALDPPNIVLAAEEHRRSPLWLGLPPAVEQHHVPVPRDGERAEPVSDVKDLEQHPAVEHHPALRRVRRAAALKR